MWSLLHKYSIKEKGLELTLVLVYSTNVFKDQYTLSNLRYSNGYTGSILRES